ncbi:hypothetical protein BVD23_13765 [Salmonella enterica]|nr:hypothetical protein [Salmonella enterica]ECJ5919464.1 hypothetical protein [Salmonella enterica subsp. salamae]EAN4945350.1 hypothetical protein [Salmonella enterica]EAX8455796.1 hypothetical protein [Salmonella enterica]EAX8555016.1 hypothetical protein [Salmonella enterica]
MTLPDGVAPSGNINRYAPTCGDSASSPPVPSSPAFCAGIAARHCYCQYRHPGQRFSFSQT